MLMPSDKEYQQTKQRKKNGEAPPSPFRELADWISLTYEVTVLDIHHNIIPNGNIPRLNVVLERKKDKSKFKEGQNYNKAKLNSIQAKFASLLSEFGVGKYRTDSLFICFSAFDVVAKTEANENVTKDELESLRMSLENPELWTISRLFDSATFFFYTNEQVALAEAKGLHKRYSEEYAKIVETKDEFGYLARSGVMIAFDSKENFDAKYGGSWFNYYR